MFNTAKPLTMSYNPFNLMTSIKSGTELDCMFEMVMLDFNFLMSFTVFDLIIHTNNTISFFQWLQHHPDTMDNFLFIAGTMLFLQGSLTFVLDFCPSNLEPICCIVEQLAMALLQYNSSGLQWDDSFYSSKQYKFMPATRISHHRGAILSIRSMQYTPHHCLVDDDVLGKIFKITKSNKTFHQNQSNIHPVGGVQ